MERDQVKSVLECLLFVTDHPLKPDELADLTGAPKADIQPLVDELAAEYEGRKSALQVVKVAEGYQIASQPGYSFWVKKLFKDRTTFRLSQSALETLSIVAYKQPITRAEIEEIRGVEVTAVLETLMERKLLKIAGRKETVGRPLLYATSQEFLRHFNLWRISDLPSLEDLAKEAELKKGQAPAELEAEPAAQAELPIPENAAVEAQVAETAAPEAEAAVAVAEPIATPEDNPEGEKTNA